MNKNKIYDILIIILLYVGISCLPFSLLNISQNLVIIFQILAQILIFFLIRIFFKKSSLTYNCENKNRKIVFIFIPTFLVCFSNYFTLIDSANSISFSTDLALYLSVVLSLCIAVNEEIIFRRIYLSNFMVDSRPLVKIIASSAIFGLCHITHFLTTFNVIDLVTIAYTFGIGIILGLIYVYYHSISLTIVFHFMYNVFNGVLADKWISIGSLKSYYLINACVGIVVGIYLLIIYLTKLIKLEAKN